MVNMTGVKVQSLSSSSSSLSRCVLGGSRGDSFLFLFMGDVPASGHCGICLYNKGGSLAILRAYPVRVTLLLRSELNSEARNKGVHGLPHLHGAQASSAKDCPAPLALLSPHPRKRRNTMCPIAKGVLTTEKTSQGNGCSTPWPVERSASVPNESRPTGLSFAIKARACGFNLIVTPARSIGTTSSPVRMTKSTLLRSSETDRKTKLTSALGRLARTASRKRAIHARHERHQRRHPQPAPCQPLPCGAPSEEKTSILGTESCHPPHQLPPQWLKHRCRS